MSLEKGTLVIRLVPGRSGQRFSQGFLVSPPLRPVRPLNEALPPPFHLKIGLGVGKPLYVQRS